ncbi:hypothetical protein LY90DRAFT_511491 [Neocallimastix californiae]|jgi:hypothetical protein|uniref:Uncharacterized protein n=1 Tax=Neocallimastix californiae TaxID=1754190 RepID=A0A1Y2BPB3_9FUNG|nr:hypothetical protein LY90DRAFT_511491 [Neocallimastix californiae]|eukprot:ORY36594.1 hypothetical protein LY90DRAFT_511491 [Neocallimastix californiae]
MLSIEEPISKEIIPYEELISLNYKTDNVLEYSKEMTKQYKVDLKLIDEKFIYISAINDIKELIYQKYLEYDDFLNFDFSLFKHYTTINCIYEAIMYSLREDKYSIKVQSNTYLVLNVQIIKDIPKTTTMEFSLDRIYHTSSTENQEFGNEINDLKQKNGILRKNNEKKVIKYNELKKLKETYDNLISENKKLKNEKNETEKKLRK